jgi:Ca-activated chloride channel family protein
MNNPHRKAFRHALLTLLTCVLFALGASKTALCQQTTAKPADSPASQLQNAKPLVFTVTVTNKKGDYVTGLERSHFTLLDDKMPRDITYFKAQDEPLSIGILLDVSRSMFMSSNRKLTKAFFNESLARFVHQGNGSNEYFLVAFNERPQLLTEWTSKADDLNAALHKVGSVEQKGNRTALYDACYLGIEKIAGSRHPKRALVLISDGQDNNSHYTMRELQRALAESDVTLYVVGISGLDERNTTVGMAGMGILDELAKSSGGVSFFPSKPSQVRQFFDFIAAELRQQYSVGFNPANYPGDREWHHVKIKLAIPSDAPREFRHLSARSREGYYPKVSQR